MPEDHDDFQNELREVFDMEAEERLGAITAAIIELEKVQDPETQAETIETVFREVHNLKGAARAVNAEEIEAVCQALEGLFSDLKRGYLSISSQLMDTFHEAIDFLIALTKGSQGDMNDDPDVIVSKLGMVRQGQGGEPRKAPPAAPQHEAAKAQVRSPQTTRSEARSPQASKSVASTKHTVRISTEKIATLLREAEEMSSIKQSAAHQYSELSELSTLLRTWEREWRKFRRDIAISAGEDEHDRLSQVLEFVEWAGDLLKESERRLAKVTTAAEVSLRSWPRMVDGQLDDIKKALMLPFSTLSQGFPKVVRDLCRQQGKPVELVMQGGEVEVGKTVLDQLKAPLIHLLRNCVDHGIEEPEVRRRRGKPEQATVRVTASQLASNRFEIVVADDGDGIDISKVKESAVKNELMERFDADQLDAAAASLLIFESGLSTSPLITDVSGRGLGLSIVRDVVEKLGGTISVQTQPHQGTSFRLVLPMTVATFRGIVVESRGETLVVPATSVERVLRVKKTSIRRVENRPTIAVGDRFVPVFDLGQALQLSLPEDTGDQEYVKALVIRLVEKRVAVSVDEIVTEQEVLVKPLGKFAKIRHVAGATLLGPDVVVPVLDVPGLTASFGPDFTKQSLQSKPEQEPVQQQKSILLVEDSISSRMVLKNLLESNGFKVTTAVNGMDAVTHLRQDSFNLVVSDVEMPKMTGFELTAWIRRETRMKDLPVVLVTTLETQEDRERGIEVGANAYIVKRDFDRGNLLEVVQKMI